MTHSFGTRRVVVAAMVIAAAGFLAAEWGSLTAAVGAIARLGPITLTAGLCVVGMAMPTWVYYNGGREKEAAMRFDLLRSVQTGERGTCTERWRGVGANEWMDGALARVWRGVA